MSATNIVFYSDAASSNIVDELREAVLPLNQYSDDEDEIAKVVAYSLLSLLWDKDAPDDNIDYQNVSEPQDLGYDDPLVLETFYYEQEKICSLIWGLVRDIIAFYGVPQAAKALIENMENFPPAWYLAARWKEAEKEYGPHPKGLTVIEDPATKEYQLIVKKTS